MRICKQVMEGLGRRPRRGTMFVICVLVAMTAGAAPAPQAAQSSASQPAGKTARTKAEVEALIAQAGSTRPDWWDSVELKYPDTLDLTWSNENAGGGWQPQKKLGAYMFSVIGSNPNRYREGVKLLSYVVTVNKNNAQRLARSMGALAWAYYELLEDYPRAVYWWRMEAKVQPARRSPTLELARCYYKLGSREMAVELISRYSRDDTRHAGLIRLWAEMGDTTRALAMAEAKAKAGMPDTAYLAAGDICRQTGDFKRAMAYYRKAIEVTQTFGRDLDRNKQRAQRNLEGIQVLEALDLARIRDGTYAGSAVGYKGPLDVEVAIRAGRLESVRISRTSEDRPLTALAEMPERIVQKQGLKGVDIVSGATFTSDAVLNATGKALQNAMKWDPP